MTGILAVLCIIGLLVSPLVFLVSGLPRVTALFAIREENVVMWQAWVGLSLGSVALLGLVIVLLA